jgi:Protein of unknown function (DUF2530)
VSQSRPGGPGARRPAPPPKEADDRQVTAVITVGWAIALAVLLAVRHSLPVGARWWVWTCAFGLAMGLFGLWYVPFLKRHRARLAARRGQLSEVSESGPADSAASVSETASVAEASGSNTVSSTETPGRSTKS